MKTLIELFDATETRNGVKVSYCLYDDAGQANVGTTIPSEKLEEYIVENDLHAYEFINWKHVSLECDGLDRGYRDPSEYLTENLSEIVLDYLQDLSVKADKKIEEAA